METEMTTKERIVYESLKLFSQKGYDGVSMREIAAAVGIKGASIYNHFTGKDDIFQAIFAEMTKHYDKMAAMMSLPTQESEQTIEIYASMELEQMLTMAEGLFLFFTQDEFAVLFRRLLMSEQHKSELAAKYLRNYYIDAPILFQSHIFQGMQQKGIFQSYDAQMMAIHFYSPIYYILNRFDAGYPYEECLEQIKEHVHVFCGLYQK